MPTAFQNSIQPNYALEESVVIRRFRENLQENSARAEKEFWGNIERETAPIFEEIAGDAENIGCTFLFKGDDRTKSVFVNLPPFSRLSPEDFQMSQVAETNVWFAVVKLPVSSRFAYSFVVNSPFIRVNPESAKNEIAAFRAASQTDPLNPNRLNDSHSFVETPGAEVQKYLQKTTENETGKVEQFSLKSEILSNERTISIYTPVGYDASEIYPLLIFFDEEIYLKEIGAARILDNLIGEKLIPPVVAAFVGNAPDARAKELACHPPFAGFVISELLDWIKKSYGVAGNPAETLVGGASFGGLSAVYTGLSYPEVFGKVFSQSGSFWRNYDAVIAKIDGLYAAQQTFYLDAGIYELESRNGISLLDANRNLHERLTAKGYAVEYREFRGGHGAVNWRETFAEGLIFLLNDLTKNRNLTGNLNLF